MSSVVCRGGRETHSRTGRTWLGPGGGYSTVSPQVAHTVIPFKDISAHTDLSACPSASIYHLESIIFHSVYHSSLYVLSTSADNCFPSPSALCLRLFIAPLLLCRPQSMAPPSPHRSTLSRLLICAKGCRRREGWGGELHPDRGWIICTFQFPQF